MKKLLILILFFSLFFIAGCSKNDSITKPRQTACTEEAKVCPDGSAVGRTGPNCEFASCPEVGKDANTGLANPAASYCLKQGGKSIIVNNPDGSQGGNCVLADGKICEEWAYFRKDCKSENVEEEAANDSFKFSPAAIKKIYTKDENTFLTIDILTLNPNFLPGETDFFINQNPKLRNVEISKNAKAYRCNNEMKANKLTTINNYLDYIKNGLNRVTIENGNQMISSYFDIEKGVVTGIYEQCLP